MASPQKIEAAAANATSTVKSLVGIGEGAAHDLQAQLETLRADMAQLMSSVTALGKVKTDEAAAAVSETAEALRRHGSEQLAGLKGRSEAVVAKAAELARNRPAEAMAIAAALGFVAGLLVLRR